MLLIVIFTDFQKPSLRIREIGSRFLQEHFITVNKGFQPSEFSTHGKHIHFYKGVVLLAVFNFFAETLPTLMLIAAGVIFTVRLKFFQFRPVRLTFAAIKSSVKEGNRNIFSYFSTSLAGAVGTGNIIGVATAITIGGPGAIFWMWCAGLLGMATKYAEVFLAGKNSLFCKNGNFSPMSYIRKAFGNGLFPEIFAFFGLASAFTMGNMLQSNTASLCLSDTFPRLHPGIFGAVIGIVVLCVTVGGLKRITSVFEKSIPFMTVIFILLGLFCCIKNARVIPGVFRIIFRSAFNPGAAAGGIAGVTFMTCLRTGAVKGLMSNEAGMGSAGFAYANAVGASPGLQGLWGALDVFTDTIVLSTVTALIIMTCPLFPAAVPSVLDASTYSFGPAAAVAVTVCIFFFAVASVITWSYYGESCFSFLTNGEFILVYRIVFAAFAVLGSISSPMSVWNIAEAANAGMLYTNLPALFALRKDVHLYREDR